MRIDYNPISGRWNFLLYDHCFIPSRKSKETACGVKIEDAKYVTTEIFEYHPAVGCEMCKKSDIYNHLKIDPPLKGYVRAR